MSTNNVEEDRPLEYFCNRFCVCVYDLMFRKIMIMKLNLNGHYLPTL